MMGRYLYQWEHETGAILGEKHELRELEDAICQLDDHITIGLVDDPFEWELVSFDSNNLTNGYSVAI